MYTIFGGKGFIGGNIARKLSKDGIEIFIPEKNDESIFGKNLGKVIYCAGLSADFRQRPYDTVDAHVGYLSKVLRNTNFDSFVYLSSVKVYSNSIHGNEDISSIVNPNNPDDLFNISKLMGESLCLNSGKHNVKIARISNVCGDDFESNNFLYSIIIDAVEKNEIILRTALDSERDYIYIDDVVKILLQLADTSKGGIYNIASGKNITNETVIDIIREITNCSVKVVQNAISMKFPQIETSKIKNEFNFEPIETEIIIKNLVINYIAKKGI